MKTSLLTLGLLFTLSLMSYASTDTANIGLDLNSPKGVIAYTDYYNRPPTYFNCNSVIYWKDTLARIVDYEGITHRMHYWQGQWYDEAWVRHGHHKEGMKDFQSQTIKEIKVTLL